MRIHLPARLAALERKRPGILPAIGVGAALVAAYAGLAALRRGSAPAAPAPLPSLSDLSSAGLGLDSGVPPWPTMATPPIGVSPGGGGYDPIPPVVNVGPTPAPISSFSRGPGGILSGSPARPPVTSSPAPTGTIGGSRGGVAVTRQGDVTASHLATVPTTTAHAGPRPPSFDIAHHAAPPSASRVAPASWDVTHHPARPRRIAPASWDNAHHPRRAASSYSAHRALVPAGASKQVRTA